jgi:hypothetical protein
MIDIDTIYTTLDSAFSSDNVLDILMEFERTLDNLDIYVFRNWIKGEIVEGPQIDRYWITVSLMYPYKMMPDPAGAERLVDHGCKVWYGKEVLKYVGKIKGDEDYEVDENGKLKAKLLESPVWLVKITMPRHFVDEMQTDKVDTDSGKVDMEDVSNAYDENLNDDEAAKGNANEENTEQQPE